MRVLHDGDDLERLDERVFALKHADGGRGCLHRVALGDAVGKECRAENALKVEQVTALTLDGDCDAHANVGAVLIGFGPACPVGRRLQIR